MIKNKLASKYTVPPFTVLNSQMGYWAKRKEYWKTEKKCGYLLGINEYCQSKKSTKTEYSLKASGKKSVSVEVSLFDPVLAEISYRWFCPKNGKILDPFAGGAVRGIVAESLGYSYTGVDLRKEQIAANLENCIVAGVKPTYICSDSMLVDKYISKNTVDFLFSCPPYFNLEKYSDDPHDLSNMDYDCFIQAYRQIIFKSCKCLKNDRFACFVVGDVRDKNGFYRDFVGATKKAFYDAGLKLYNEMIFAENIASAALRCQKTFDAGRKVVKTHQNVLVFYKGNPRTIKSNFGTDGLIVDD